jgi:predicted molibdopterin-dependent oxidoreductase YjgC
MGCDMVTTLEEGASTSSASNLAAEIGPFETDLAELQSSDCVVMLGADLANDAQVMGFMIKRALPTSTALVLIDASDNAFEPLARVALKPAAGTEKFVARGLAAAVVKAGLAKVNPNGLDADVELQDAVQKTGIPASLFSQAAGLIAGATQPVFVYGKDLGPAALKATADLANLVGAGKKLLGARTSANSLAAAQFGLDQPFKRNGHQAVYVALGDDTPAQHLIQEIEGVPFLAVQASYNSRLTAMADVVLPVEMWAETSGYYLNIDGRMQAAVPAISLTGEIRSNKEALEAVAGALEVSIAFDWLAELEQRKSPVAFAAA